MRAFLCLSAPLLALASFAAAQSVVGQIDGSAHDPGGLMVSKRPHQVEVPWPPLHEVEIEVLLVRQ